MQVSKESSVDRTKIPRNGTSSSFITTGILVVKVSVPMSLHATRNRLQERSSLRLKST